jgi:hypothetical protein
MHDFSLDDHEANGDNPFLSQDLGCMDLGLFAPFIRSDRKYQSMATTSLVVGEDVEIASIVLWICTNQSMTTVLVILRNVRPTLAKNWTT